MDTESLPAGLLAFSYAAYITSYIRCIGLSLCSVPERQLKTSVYFPSHSFSLSEIYGWSEEKYPLKIDDVIVKPQRLANVIPQTKLSDFLENDWPDFKLAASIL